MFKFTIRESILMTTIVAVLLMWWMERNQNAKNDARLTVIETRLQVLPMPAPPTPTVVTSSFMPAYVPAPLPAQNTTTNGMPVIPITPATPSAVR